MRKFAGYVFAFCTFWVIVLSIGAAHGRALKLTENFTYYKTSQVQWGATTLPLAAQLNYEAAIHQIQEGNVDNAVTYLNEAIRLDPSFSDAYLTLSNLKFRRFDTDALYYLVLGFRSFLESFTGQSLLVVNTVLFAAFLLVILTTIICVSFAIRYLPFVTHKISELLRVRFHATFPRLTAYLIILIPFALFPGFIYGICFIVVMTWYFMHRRERVVLMVLVTPFVLLGIFAPKTKQLNPLADPGSFTHLATKAINSSGDARLINDIENCEAPSLKAEKHVCLGLLFLRRENFDTAASHFFSAIELRPNDPMGYINLGNVYYLQGRFEKALEGYRKAAQIDDNDEVGQYNLAQAYIKTLLLAESSTALKKASALGIDKIKQSYAEIARHDIQVYAKTFSNSDLWRIAQIESHGHTGNFLNNVLRPVTRASAGMSAWLLIGAFLTALILSRVLKKRHLSFQCSNCGELTCDNCCYDSGATFLCPACAEMTKGVSSDKVIEALLRQRRQIAIVKRNKTIRAFTPWIPGVRDIFYGRLTRGLALASVFSLSLILLWSKGFIVKDWNSLVTVVPLWKWILPVGGIVVTYSLSLFSKRHYEVRDYRTPNIRQRRKDTVKDDPSLKRASA